MGFLIKEISIEALRVVCVGTVVLKSGQSGEINILEHVYSFVYNLKCALEYRCDVIPEERS